MTDPDDLGPLRWTDWLAIGAVAALILALWIAAIATIVHWAHVIGSG